MFFSPNFQKSSEFFRGVKASLPVVLAFIPFALVLGAQAMQKGLSIIEVPLMTGLNFAGGSEFAAVNLWSATPQIFLIVAVSILVNSRHILMSATLVPHLYHLPKRKVLPALFLMCDESWAMALNDAKTRPNQALSLYYYLGLSICFYITWIIFTFMGAVFGSQLVQLEQFGFDMVFTAIFLFLLKGMWQGISLSLPWLVSLVIACITYKWVEGVWYVITGSLSGILFAVLWGNKQ